MSRKKERKQQQEILEIKCQFLTIKSKGLSWKGVIVIAMILLFLYFKDIPC